MRKNIKLEEDIGRTIKNCYGGIGPINNGSIPFMSKMLVIIFCLLIVSGFIFAGKAYIKGYDQCKKDFLSKKDLVNTAPIYMGTTPIFGTYNQLIKLEKKDDMS